MENDYKYLIELIPVIARLTEDELDDLSKLVWVESDEFENAE